MKIGQPKTILIVEDEPIMRELIADGFTSDRTPFTVLQAKDGLEGLDMALKNRPDLIVLDIAMPKMDGMVVLKKIRETPWGKKVPVIVLTNLNANDEIMAGVTRHEPSYYIMKANCEIGELVQKAKQELGIAQPVESY